MLDSACAQFACWFRMLPLHRHHGGVHRHLPTNAMRTAMANCRKVTTRTAKGMMRRL